LEPILHRTRKQQFDEPSVSRFRGSFEEIFTTIEAFNLELLPGLDVIFAPYFGWKNDLTFGRNGSPHERKITSYQARVNNENDNGILPNVTAYPSQSSAVNPIRADYLHCAAGPYVVACWTIEAGAAAGSTVRAPKG